MWIGVAGLLWSAAFAILTGVWWPFAVLAFAAAVGGFWLKSARQEFYKLVITVTAALALLALRMPVVSGETSLAKVTEPSIWPFQNLREASKDVLFGLNPDAEALTLGLAIGDSSLASETLLSAMRDTSLTHLVAVSGSNCAIVSGAVFLALQRFGVRVRVICSLAALLSYLFLVGPQPSVLRAATMAAAILLAYLSGRKVKPVVALSLAVSALVLANPAISVEYGFALSVAATTGILVLAPRIHENLQKRLPNWVALALSVGVSAQLLCFPILLQLQDRVPTYSIIANLLSEPLVAPVTVLAILAVTISWMPPVASVLFWFASLPAAAIAFIAKSFASMPLSTAYWQPGTIGTIAAVSAVLACVVFIMARGQTLRAVSAVAIAALCFYSICIFSVEAVRLNTWPQVDWQVASCDVGQGDATVLRSANRIALIDVGKFDSKIDRCLATLQVTRIDLLVLTHFDQDHVLAVGAAIKNRQVGEVLISPFADVRPAAIHVLQVLKGVNAEVIKVQKGLSGTLGKSSWTILNPSKSAQEAEDSNDASIAMLFRFDDFSFLALADLGERGQMRLAEDLNRWQDDWVADHDLVLKVSHHGSADQYAELIEHLRPDVSLISVGKSNGYGHPTRRTLSLLGRSGSLICRTDELGSIALSRVSNGFAIANTAAG